MAEINAQERYKINTAAHNAAVSKAIMGNDISIFKWGGAALFSLPWSGKVPIWLYIIGAFLVLAFLRYFSAFEDEKTKLTKILHGVKKIELEKEQAKIDKIAADEKREAANEVIRQKEERQEAEKTKELALIEAGEVRRWKSEAAQIKAIEAELDAGLA